MAKFNKYTGELINGAQLEDDIDFEIDQFNKKIIIESHTKAALEEVAKYIDPENDEGKTLIFAASDTHADMIVRLLKDIFKETIGGVDDDSILKITGSIKDPDLAIKRFKNENYPKVVVTVDLLSTGIDVPRIDKIVFLRRIKSRILYEQMLGRATRLCDDINKTHFEIFDCVRLYEVLKDMTNMKPVAANQNTTFKILKETLERADNKEEKEADIIAFIRQQALGSPLESNEERVKGAVARIKREYYLTKPQKNWIDRIEKVMLKEVVIDKETLNTGSFKAQGGGFDRLNEKLFNGNLGDIITKLKTYMFENIS